MTPPPFNPGDNQRRPTPPPPPVNDTPTQIIQPRKRSGLLGLWIGLGVIGIAGITALVMWLLLRDSSRSYEYSDGQNPEVQKETYASDLYSEQPAVPVERETPVQTAYSGPAFINGTIGDFPFTMDLNMQSDGGVTGTYWNVLYNIKLPVRGRILRNGDLDLTLGSGSTESQLYMNARGAGRYGGSWGKKQQEVVAAYEEGERPKGRVNTTGAKRFRVTGGGINSIARISDMYFWYEDQTPDMAHALRLEDNNDDGYEIYNSAGLQIGDIHLFHSPYGISGVMTDIAGRRFELLEE